jgi:peptidyl-prolyl cis-trans isomerase SurA
MLTLAFVLAIATPARAEEPEVVNYIVAQVNGDVITRAGYLRELEGLHDELKAQMQGKRDAEVETEYEKLKTGVLDTMIDDLLLKQKAKELGIDEDVEVEVNRRMLQVAQANNLPTMEKLEEELRKDGMNLDDVRATVRKPIQRQRVLELEVLEPLVGRGGTTEQVEAARKEYLKKLREDAFVKITDATP